MTTATDHYRRQLFALAQSTRGKRMLEIGGGPEGVSGIVFCKAMGAGGELWTVDINPNHPPAVVRQLTEHDTGARWGHIAGDSLTADIGRINASLLFDLLYIDGSHDQEHAGGDFARFTPLLRPGALVVFDDYHGTQGVGAAVHALIAEGWSGIRMIYDHGNGNSHYVMQIPNGGAR
jgi:predicted O-methyltransferase YrrM